MLWAFLAMGLFAGWQTLTVERNYGGNWTSLFCTGSLQRIPPDLIRGTYLFQGRGYDGQMYRYVAHDPWLQGLDHKYLDSLSLRERRILIPVLAWTLALGQPNRIDLAYLTILCICVFAGCYWTSRWMLLSKYSPAWGLLYLIVPSTLVAADRCTIDVATSSLTIALLLYLRLRNYRMLVLCGMAICLSRETGLLILLAVALSLALERRWRIAFALLTAAIPTLAWYAFVYLHAPGAARDALPDWLLKGSPAGIFIRLWRPAYYPFQPAIDLLAQSLDRLALLGMLLAFCLAVLFWRKRPSGASQLTGLFFLAMLPLVSSAQFWDAAYGYSRPFSPLLIVIAMSAAETRVYGRVFQWIGAAPTLMIFPRLLLQLGPQIAGLFGIHVR